MDTLLQLFRDYIEWARALDFEDRFYIWAWCLFGLFIYIVIDNWGAEWMKDDDWRDPPQI